LIKSAGIIRFRRVSELEFLLLKPGGPFYKNQETGIWTFSKGAIANGEDSYSAAIREFKEETGYEIEGSLLHLGEFKLRKDKKVTVYLNEGDFNESKLSSKSITLEYPKGSGKKLSFAEMIEAKWMNLEKTKAHVFKNQIEIFEIAAKKILD
jgi:predicted NUDIX family NTP pyrophosphohydrolase